MKTSKWLIWLSVLVAVLEIVAAGAGLFSQGGGGSYSYTTLRGQSVEIYGRGVYQYDMAFKAPIFRGTDAVMLFIAVPLLVVAILLYRRGSLRGRLLLMGLLSVFLYNAVSVSFGTAYNNLILVYVLYLSASIFAFALACRSVDARMVAGLVKPGMPHRRIAVFMAVAGLSVIIWLIEIINGLASGQTPAGIGSYTTEITYFLDLAIIVPMAYLSSALILRRHPMGYLTNLCMLMGNALIGLIVIGQTVVQMLDGIFLPIGQLIGYVGTFAVMGTIAIRMLFLFFGNLAEPVLDQSARQSALAEPISAD